MKTNFETLNNALNKVKKSQTNFVNGDGKDNQDSIHSQSVGNENGSISRTSSADGKGDDPVDSSDSTKKNPVGQEGKGVHSPGTRTHSAHSVKDPVNTSGDGHADDPENKSVNTKDYTKDKNGVREPDTQQHGSTRKLSDKPNGNAQEEDHALNHSTGTKHNDADLSASIDKLVNLSKGLIHSVQVNAGNINALKSEHMGVMNTLNQLQKSLKAPGIKRNTVDKSTAVDNMTGASDKHQNDDEEEKHMPKANVRGMFYHAEHSKGKKHTKEMADAENAVTRCHNSHKSLTDDQWADIEANAAITAAKSMINQLNDENIAKSLDSKLVHDAQTGNKAALGRDNYKYDQSEKAAHAKKSEQPASTASKSVKKSNKHSLADLMSLAASYKNDGNDSAVAHCDSMCNAMKSGKAAKSEMADLFKNINNVDHNSKANTSNIRANSSQKPTSKSDDIDNSTKSESASSDTATKSMPQGRAYTSTMNSKNTSAKKPTVKKSIVNPTILRNRAKLYKSVIKSRAKHMYGSQPVVKKSLQMIDKGVQNNDPQFLQKSITNFKTIVK